MPWSTSTTASLERSASLVRPQTAIDYLQETRCCHEVVVVVVAVVVVVIAAP